MPAEAFLEVTGELVTYVALDTPYEANVQVGFVNNGIMALFRSAVYMIDGKEIETIQDNVDAATTIIGLARYSDDYTRSAGPTMMFAKDNSDHPNGRPVIRYSMLADSFAATFNKLADTPDKPAAATAVSAPNPEYNLGFAMRKSMLSGERRKFSCAIPLSHIFGFCRGVRKVIFGANHTVVLHRKPEDNDTIWRQDDVDAGKVVLSKLAL